MSRKSIIVAGSKSIDDRKLVKNVIKESPHSVFGNELVTGGAEGVDTIAKEEFADPYIDVDYKEFVPEWEKYGFSAGPIRNKEMAEYSDALIAIWDGESNGTKNMIETALNHSLDVYVKIVDVQSEGIVDC